MLLARVIFDFETPALETEFNQNYLFPSPLRKPISLILYREIIYFVRESYAKLIECTCFRTLNLMVHIVTTGKFVIFFSNYPLPIEINASSARNSVAHSWFAAESHR
jgi:hypothetical protein